jgi:hypothetical protein
MSRFGKAISKTELEKLIADEVNIYAGTRAVIKASILERLIVRSVRCDKLHPNPDDEFTDPKIGPNYQIVSSYVDAIKRARFYTETPWQDDPVIIEKTFPSGYLLLNGHHRWAACMMFGEPKTVCQIVNLTQQKDIEKMLKGSQNTKRAALDFDEVVMELNDEDLCEPPLGHIRRVFYKERLRLGIPALFRFLSQQGYDIWVYSYKYHSYDYMKHLFRLYHARVDGIITGAGRKSNAFKEQKAHRDKLFSEKYSETVHISIDSIMRTKTDTKEAQEFEIRESGALWYKEVINAIGGFDKDE